MSAQRGAILELARRYDYDARHAHQVECLAGTLFMEMQPLHQLEDADRKLLEYAAILHDIGYYAGACGHHRHTLQMIMMEPLSDFSREEKTVIANIARYHRKALPSLEHTAYAILDEAARRRVALLAPLLRIADALDRSHRELVQELFCDIGAALVTVRASSEHTLSAEALALDRRADLFRLVYRREVALEVVRPTLSLTGTP
jgi:exopolyphosphatase/guanosine-5'-triphosphate,3'-diphosphate pyrophosphatase